MQNNIGYPEAERIEIIVAIFGKKKNGLRQNTNVDTFEYRHRELERIIEEKDSKVGEKKFMPYFRNKLFPLLKQHVIELVKNRKITGAWTNNNYESANH